MCFNSFSQEYVLAGDALSLGSDCYLVTAAVNDQNGAVWYEDQLDLTQPFDLQFEMNFGANDENGADGMVFVLQTVGTNALGIVGGGIGFEGFSPSLGVEFDTWANNDQGDPFYDHISVVSNGSVNHNLGTNISGPVQADPFDINIEDSQYHVVQITWDPETTIVTVYFDCFLRLTASVDMVNEIFGGENMVYWGFTGATGGSNNNQRVCLSPDIISTDLEATICQGASIELGVNANALGDISWTPNETLSDSTIVNPIASPLETTTYIVEYEDLCGDPLTSSYTVNVETVEVAINEESPIITCETPDQLLTYNSAFEDLDVQWINGNGNAISNEPDGSISVNEGGWYILNASVQDVCFASDSVLVLEDIQEFPVTLTADGIINCATNNASVTANVDNNAEIVWSASPGASFSETADPFVIQANSSGTYIVEATNPNSGCVTTDEVTVALDLEAPFVEAGTTDSLSCQNPLLVIPGVFFNTEFDSFWSTTDGNLLDTSDPVLPTVSSPGVYYLTVIDPNNFCSSIDSVEIKLDGNTGIDIIDVQIPNIITANNDNLNDELKPYLLSDIGFELKDVMQNVDIQVYNRWGNLVYEASDASYWKGESDGVELESGTYFYKMSFDIVCGEQTKFDRNGMIQLIREK